MRGIILATALLLAVAQASSIAKPQKVEASKFQCPEDDGLFDYYPAESNCIKFYNCIAGYPLKLPCPWMINGWQWEQKRFSTKTGHCEWPDQVDCGDRPVCNWFDENCDEEVGGGECEDLGKCKDHDPLEPLPQGKCHSGYCQCVHESYIYRPCPGDLVFNEEKQHCDHPESVGC